MKSIYMPSESFQSNKEVNILNKYFASSYKSLLDDIDEKIEVWIIGNKDKDFFNSQVEIPMREHRVLDPADELPISCYRELCHIAVVNYRFSEAVNVNREFLYGNTDYNISDFVSAVMERLRGKFPKKKVRLIKNEIKEKYEKEKNNISHLQKRKRTRDYYSDLIRCNANKYPSA